MTGIGYTNVTTGLIQGNSPSNGWGIYLNDSFNITLTNNIVHAGAFEGFYFLNSSNNTLNNNTDNQNAGSGFYFSNSNNNYLYNNRANGTGSDGFHFDKSSNNNMLLLNSTFNINGIYLSSDSNFNSINISEFCNSSSYDIEEEDSNKGGWNMCTKPHNWNDTGTTNCTYLCGTIPPTPNQPNNLNIFSNYGQRETSWLNWSIVLGANGYNIYFSDNLSYLLRMNESTAPIPNAITWGETSNLYNDTDANNSIRRFYRVSAFIWQAQNLTNVTETAGMYRITILADGANGEGTFSYPIQQTINISDAIPNPPNDFSVIYTFSNATGQWIFDVWRDGSWHTDNGFDMINFSEGYWTFGFTQEVNMTNIGKIPLGIANQTITSGGINGEGTLGWRSITTGENISNVIPLAPNDFSVIYTYVGSSYGGWIFDVWRDGSWHTDNGFLTFEPTFGYWTFGFTQETPMNYTQNPY
jgi:parallel beta-helix repeat protein